MIKKICSKCKLELDITDFHQDKSKKCGYKSACKSCIYLYQKKYKKTNSEIIRVKRHNYYVINKSFYSEQSKIYREKNKEILKQKRKLKYQNNHMHRLKCIVRRRINLYIKNKSKNSKEIIGCSYEELLKHIENKFTTGMCWELVGKEIHIDHIIPLSLAKTEEELYSLCHYTNLQPLWAKDNLAKSNKLQ
jgi:hypothetical protein